MLSLFPQLFAYRELAPFILRLVLGLIFISFGYPKTFKRLEQNHFQRALGILELGGGILLIAGLFIQIAAILLIIARIAAISKSSEKNYRLNILIIASLVSLLLLGPGLFSFDLPL
jgi:putative oxidoreductase